MYSREWVAYLKRESISRKGHLRKCWSLIWDLIQMGFVLGVHSFAPRYFQNQFKKRLAELNKRSKEMGIWIPNDLFYKYKTTINVKIYCDIGLSLRLRVIL